MGRIDTNIASLIAQQGLAQSQQAEQTSLQRLSTGLRINSGADDPAGLIVSQGLQSEMAGITQAISNSSQANNVVSTAEGALSEVSSLLLNIKSLVVQAANSGAESAAEIQANQLQVDSAVQSITRISDTTSFDGLNLIDGSLGYITSGVATSAITALNISQADLGKQTSIPVNLDVITSARPAELTFGTSQIASTVTLQISGNEGVQTLTFTSGTHASAIAFAVNQVSDSTGVSATLLSATANPLSGIVFKSGGYGTSNFVSISVLQGGAFQTTNAAGADVQRSVGVDAVATVNGALTVGNGLDIQLNTSGLDMDLTLNQSFGAGKTSFSITGGGATFQIGPQVSSNQQVSIGIGSVAASHLGNSQVGYLSDIVTGGSQSLVSGKAAGAEAIVEQAITQVAELSGRLGAFQENTLNTTSDSLQVALENVTSSESDITDTNFASETANLTRAQILVSAGTSVLATANSTPNSVLQLLQGA
jgi:flagellin